MNKIFAMAALLMCFHAQAQTPSPNPRGYIFKLDGDVNSGNLAGILSDSSNPVLAGPFSCIGDQGAEDEFTLGCDPLEQVNPSMNNLTPGPVSEDGEVQWVGGVTLSGPEIEGGPLFLICKSVASKGGGVVPPITCE